MFELYASALLALCAFAAGALAWHFTRPHRDLVGRLWRRWFRD